MTFSRQLGTPTAAGEVSVEVMINGADGDRRRRSIMEAGAKMRQELFFGHWCHPSPSQFLIFHESAVPID